MSRPWKMHLSNGYRTYINWRYVRAMFKNGKDTAEIAEAYSTTEARIYNGLARGKGMPAKFDPELRSPSPGMNVVRHVRTS